MGKQSKRTKQSMTSGKGTKSSNSSLLGTCTVVLTVAVLAVAWYFTLGYPRQTIPAHLLGHKAVSIDNLLTESKLVSGV